MPIKDKTGKGLIIQLPSLVGTQEFTPTGLMIKTICAYLLAFERDEFVLPYKILEKLGASNKNWYNWLKKDGFIKWWNRACGDYHADIGLGRIHVAIYRRALGNSSQDAKLYLERFDKDYKPTTGKEHTFPGLEPPADLPGAIERSRERAKMVASEAKDTISENNSNKPPEVITPDKSGDENKEGSK